ncbi:MAG TPA: hypothetical protein VM686_30065 [Polyangiaceae bacterium]|nr:hypothetical protein [Polyangiaceae bacterium]
MLRALLCCSLALAAFARAPAAQACACRGVGSPSAALTLSHETWGVGLVGVSELGHGVWDGDGEYHVLGAGERFSRETLGLTLALRVHPDWEVSIGGELVSARVTTPSFADENSGMGDVHARARWDFADEPMPHEDDFPWPAAALIGSLGAATAEAGPNRAASTGLGTSESAVALELVRSLPGAWQLEALGELGVRAPDTTLGRERQLGPRALFVLGLSHALVPELRVGGYTSLTLEADTSYDGEVAAGSGQRLWNLSLFLVHELESLNARASLTLEYAPPVDGISANAIGYTGVRAAFSFAR